MSYGRISEQIAKGMVELIVAGELTVGDRLPSERSLADERGVSRSAVREGYRILEGLKIVESRHGAGVFVSSQPTTGLSFATIFQGQAIAIEDLLAITDVMSGRCGQLAAIGITDDEVSALQAILRQQSMAAATVDLKALGDLDLQFHVAIARATRNPIFVEFEHYLCTTLEQHRRLLLGADPTDSLVEHRQIVAGLAARDPHRAGAACRLHSLRSNAAVRQVIKRQVGDQSVPGAPDQIPDVAAVVEQLS
jgi:DNA-binding FadR family transcriptional regulator